MNRIEQLERQNAVLREQNEKFASDAKLLLEEVAKLGDEKQKLIKKNEAISDELRKSRDQLEALIRRLFGRQSERFDDVDQLKFEFATPEQAADAREGIEQACDENNNTGKSKPKPRRRKRNERFPESLERKQVLIDLSDEEKEGLTRIGEDIVETAHYRRPIVYILQKIYPKYVRSGEPDAGVMQMPRPESLIAGDRYDTSFAAEIIAAKFSYHLPIYRQEDLFAGCGITISRSSLLNIQEAAAKLIRPFAAYLADLVRTDHCISSDDTGVLLLLPKDIPKIDEDDPKSRRAAEVIAKAKEENAKSVRAKMWAYRGVSVPINVFDFTVSRHRDGPDLFLIDRDYEGTLLGDCYGANTGIHMRSNGLVVHAACVAHARRKAEYALGNHREHATALLKCFNRLYDLEDQCRHMDWDARFAFRQEHALPVWTLLRSYLENEMSKVSTKEKIGEAKGYLLNQWDGLVKYLGDGRIPIDNNECEQLMKQVALGRKNWLFIGSVAAGYRTADLMTLCSSAIRNDLDVYAYIKDVLDTLLSGSTDYASLRPDAWAKSHPESVRHYRAEERRQRNARRDRARLDRRLSQSESE
ncbi:transposase [Stieleria varia]|uniref:IS66 family transposase n=2 Tax=Stieleria varia TaxID=2528005 RepID=UPI00313BA7F0